MARRQRRPAQAGEFQDPLSNYDPPKYDDDFEEALSEAEVGEMEIKPFFTTDVSTTVSEAIRLMANSDFFCLLITENEKLVGIVSERDILNRVSERLDQLHDKPIREIMTPDPTVVYETDPPAKALNVMAVGGFRRIPVLGVDDKPVGILGPKRVTRFIQQYL